MRTLKVPRPEPKIKGVTAKMVEQYEDLVATVIMACPRLEAVSGPLTTYSHGFKKTFHALSTRPHLREMTWVLEPTAAQRAAQTTHKGAAAATAAANDDLLDEAGCSPFVDLHRNWQSLRQLSIHCHPGGGHLGSETVLAQTLSMLPSLEHLHLSHLPAATFDDTTLLSLPGGLRTLSLTGTGGITAGGLSAFATRPQSQDLRTLTLRHTPMTSLAALARVLSNLSSLTSVTLAQAFPPMMPEGDGDAFTLWMMPYLASASVRSIHWDITSHRDCANVADDILARSIASGGFPALRSLRTPNDPDGIFQNLCRPLERIDLSTDRFCASDMPRRQPSPPLSSSVSASTSSFDNPPTPSSGGGGTGFLFGLASPRHTPTTPHSPSFFPELAVVPSPCTDLRIARLSAQTRLERARAKPRFSVTVTDHDYPDVDGPAGRVVDKFGIGGFLGTVGSPINYVLLPDRGSADERGGAVDLRDLLYHNGDSGEPLGVGPADGVIDRNDVDRQVCCGTWNNSDGFFSEKKEKERWWHTERARWSKVQLQQ